MPIKNNMDVPKKGSDRKCPKCKSKLNDLGKCDKCDYDLSNILK